MEGGRRSSSAGAPLFRGRIRHPRGRERFVFAPNRDPVRTHAGGGGAYFYEEPCRSIRSGKPKRSRTRSTSARVRRAGNQPAPVPLAGGKRCRAGAAARHPVQRRVHPHHPGGAHGRTCGGAADHAYLGRHPVRLRVAVRVLYPQCASLPGDEIGLSGDPELFHHAAAAPGRSNARAGGTGARHDIRSGLFRPGGGDFPLRRARAFGPV